MVLAAPGCSWLLLAAPGWFDPFLLRCPVVFWVPFSKLWKSLQNDGQNYSKSDDLITSRPLGAKVLFVLGRLRLTAWRLRLQPGGSDAAWRLRLQPGGSDCSQEAQIAARSSDCSQEAQMQPGGSDYSLEAEISHTVACCSTL